MRSFRIFNRRAGAVFAAAGLVLTSTVPAIVSAATVTSRSIALSSSVKATTDVTYHVVFTASANTTDFVLDFCDSAAIGATCTPPAGLDVTNIATATAGYSVADKDTNTATVTLGTPGTSIDVELSGVDNPTDAGVFYARITTYAGTSDYTDADTLGTVVDNGSVALSATDGFGVAGRVAESMTFCASGTTLAIGTGCSTNATDPANLTLGTNGVLSTTPSEGVVKTQISTNALGGAVVYLKSDAEGCGGLLREGTGTVSERCGIAPITTAGSVTTISGAFFGLKLGNLTGQSSTTTAVEASSYDTTHYYMHWVNGDASGVTGPYGDPIYNTSGGPVSDGTADLTFGAAIDALTPAGNYKAAFNLIATGTF